MAKRSKKRQRNLQPQAQSSSSDEESNQQQQQQPEPDRSSETESKAQSESSQKEVVAGAHSTAGKKLFVKVFSDEDEIALLNGILDFKRNHSSYESRELYDYLKGLVHFDAHRNQISEKVRRLRRKYFNGSKSTARKKLSPHEKELSMLCRQIWENDSNNSIVPVEEEEEENNPEAEMQGDRPEAVFPHSDVVKVQSSLIGEIVSEEFIQEGHARIPEADRLKFDQEWRKLDVDMWKLHVRKLDVLHKHSLQLLKTRKKARK